MSLKSEAMEMIETLLESGGMSGKEAKTIAKEVVKAAKKKQIEEGTKGFPPNAAELVLSGVAFQTWPDDYGEQLKAEGVTEEDIRWWWGLPDFTRWVFFCWDDHMAMVAFISGIEKGLDPESSTREMSKNVATYRYGISYEAPPIFVGENKRLPYEMKDRVDRHIQ